MLFVEVIWGVSGGGPYDQKGKGQFVVVGVEMVDKHSEDQADDDGGKEGEGADDVEGQCWVYGWFHRGDFGGAHLGAHDEGE